MTPFELGILLHYYTTPVAHEQEDSPAPIWEPTIQAFISEKIIEPTPIAPPPDIDYKPSAYRLTQRGKAYIKYVLAVPLPMMKWVLPEELPWEEQPCRTRP